MVSRISRLPAICLIITIVVAVPLFFTDYATRPEPPQCIEACDEPMSDIPHIQPTRLGESLSMTTFVAIAVFFSSLVILAIIAGKVERVGSWFGL